MPGPEGERRLVLHVGAMKSGTTFVQSRLFSHRETLAERGIRVPGRQWRSQVLAVQQLLRGGGPMWDRHAAGIREHVGTSIVTSELLGPAPTEVARRLVASAGVPVEVVVTARDLNRSIPAMWQETLQNGRSWHWHEYVAGVEADRPSPRDGRPSTDAGRTFWIQQDLVRIVGRWAGVVGPDRVSLVTVPPPGGDPELLWERFAEVAGRGLEGLVSAPARNESLGAASALAVRRLNELLDAEGMSFPEGHQLRKRLLTKQVLAARKGVEPAVGLAVAPWVTEETERQRAGLQQLGVRLVGEWHDLAPADVPGIDPATVGEGEVTEAAIGGLAGLLVALVRRDGEPDG